MNTRAVNSSMHKRCIRIIAIVLLPSMILDSGFAVAFAADLIQRSAPSWSVGSESIGALFERAALANTAAHVRSDLGEAEKVVMRLEGQAADGVIDHPKPSDHALTVTGEPLTPQQRDQVHAAIKHDLDNKREQRVSPHIARRDFGDALLSKQLEEIEVHVMPSLSQCDAFLVAYASRGGEVRDHAKGSYLSPARYDRIERLSMRARRKFWGYELGYLNSPDESVGEVKQLVSIGIVLLELHASEILTARKWSPSRQKYLKGLADGLSLMEIAALAGVHPTRIQQYDRATLQWFTRFFRGITPGIDDSDNPLDKPVSHYFDLRGANALEDAHIGALRDLTFYSPERLMNIDGFGIHTLDQADTLLRRFGQKLADHPGDVSERIRLLPLEADSYFIRFSNQLHFLRSHGINTFGELVETLDVDVLNFLEGAGMPLAGRLRRIGLEPMKLSPVRPPEPAEGSRAIGELKLASNYERALLESDWQISSIETLVQRSEIELLRINGIGRRGLDQIKNHLWNKMQMVLRRSA